MRIVIAVMLVAVNLGMGLTHAMGNRVDVKQSQSGQDSGFKQSIVWYDGDRKKTAWLNPGLVAEFTPNDNSRRVVRQTLPEARELSVDKAGLRIWETQSADVDPAVTLKNRNPAGRYSPVWQDGRSTASGKRALPGGILVTFKPGWNVDQVMEWTKKQGLVVERAMGFGNIYLIKTDAGIAALETANRIHESGEVVSASPNWWKEVVTR